MQGHARAAQQINESFCPTSGIVNWSMLMSVKSGMSQEQQDALFELTFRALAAHMLYDDVPNWELIEKTLGRDVSEISDMEFAVLAHVFVNLSTTAYLERFLNAMAVQIGAGDNEFLLATNLAGGSIGDVDLFVMCPEKIARLLQNIENAADITLQIQRELRARGEYGSEYYNNLNNLRHTMLERAVILSLVGNVAALETSPYKNFFFGTNGNGPISLVDDPIYHFALSIQTAQGFIDNTTGANGVNLINARVASDQTHSFWLTEVLNGSSAGGAIRDIVGHNFLRQHGTSGNFGLAVLDFVTSAATLGAKDLVSTGVDIFMFGVGVLADGADEVQFEQDFADMENSQWLASYVVDRDLDAVVVRSHADVQVHIFPTSDVELPLDPQAHRDRYSFYGNRGEENDD
jgi:hypothetical protein